MKTQNLSVAVLCICLSSLSACTNMSLFKDTPSAPANGDQAALDAIPAQPIETTPLNQSATIPASSIKKLLVGKSWRWQGPKNGGVTLYAADGTSLVEVTGKGTTQGKWVVKDGQLCESFGKATFIPNGVPMKCQPFVNENGAYRVGQATFEIAG